MATRDALRQRPDIPNEDIDDLIGIASELQEADQPGVDVQDVRDVAAELDIAPEYIDQALTELSRRRADAEARHTEASATRARQLRVGGASIAGLLALLVLFVGTALPGLRRTATDLQAAEAQLTVVLDRQAALAPQLVALAGGQAKDLDALAKAQRTAPDLDTRLDKASELATAMATAIGAVPVNDDRAQQLRLNLQYEITGSQNRVDTERSRYEQARAAYDSARVGLRAGVLQGLGF